MKKTSFPLFAAVLALSLVTGFIAGKVAAVPSHMSDHAPHTVTAFDTIMKKREIRCGYVIYPPYLNRDLANGQMTGPMAQIWDAIGKRLDLKITWSEEVTWGTMIEGLRTGRYDAVCSPVWANALRSQFVAFSQPLGYQDVAAWTRADETRFDNNLAAINDPSTRISVLDGEMAVMLANRLFPKAKQLALPQNVLLSEMMMNITGGKADIALEETVAVQDFLKVNPGKVKKIPGGETIQAFPVTVLLPQNDVPLKNMIDQTLGELQRDGTIEKLMSDAGMPKEWHAPQN